MEIKYILLFIFFISFIKCDLIIIGPSDLASRYYNQPIEIVFGKMSDISNFYVHGEIVFENTRTKTVAECHSTRHFDASIVITRINISSPFFALATNDFSEYSLSNVFRMHWAIDLGTPF